jgi:hypothetical protein
VALVRFSWPGTALQLTFFSPGQAGDAEYEELENLWKLKHDSESNIYQSRVRF